MRILKKNNYIDLNMFQSYRVFLSWSRIFFSISASVSVSKNGAHWSASDGGLNGTSTVGKGASENAYVL